MNAPWYIRNSDIQRDWGMGMPDVANEIKRFAKKKHESRL